MARGSGSKDTGDERLTLSALAQISPQHLGRSEVHVLDLSRGARRFDMKENPDALPKRAGHRDLQRAQQRDIDPPHLTRSKGRECTADIWGNREDHANDVIDRERVPGRNRR